MNKTTKPSKTATTKTATAAPKPADPAKATHVRTADGYKTLSAGLTGPANPVLSATDGDRLKAVLFG